MKFSQTSELVRSPNALRETLYIVFAIYRVHMSSKKCEKMPYGALEDGWIE